LSALRVPPKSIESIVCLSMGLVCLTFWRRLGQLSFDWQYKRRGHFRPTMKIYQYGYLAAGIAFTVVGGLACAGVVTFGR